MQLPAKFLNHQYWDGGLVCCVLGVRLWCITSNFYLLTAAECKIAPIHSGFLIDLNPKNSVTLPRTPLSSLPLPTSQMVRDGELCSRKQAPQTRFSVRAKKAKLCYFGSWHIFYLLTQHVRGIWIFGSCRASKWKNEISAQEDNVKEVVRFLPLSYATALSIFIQVPGHRVVNVFQKRCYEIEVWK